MKKVFLILICVLLVFNVYSNESPRSGGKLYIKTATNDLPLSILNSDDFSQRHNIYFKINDFYQNYNVKGYVYIELYAISENEKKLLETHRGYLNQTYYTTSENLFFDPVAISYRHPDYGKVRVLTFSAVAKNIPDTGEEASYDEIFFKVDSAFSRKCDIDFSTFLEGKTVRASFDCTAYTSKYLQEEDKIQIKQNDEFVVKKDSVYIFNNNSYKEPFHLLVDKNNNEIYIQSICVEEILTENDFARISNTEVITETKTLSENSNDEIQNSVLIIRDKYIDENSKVIPLFSNMGQYWGNIVINELVISNNQCKIKFTRSSGLLYVTMKPYVEEKEFVFDIESHIDLCNKLIDYLYGAKKNNSIKK